MVNPEDDNPQHGGGGGEHHHYGVVGACVSGRAGVTSCCVLLSIGVCPVGGMPWVTVIRNTVMLSMVEMPNVVFSPDSAGMRKTNLGLIF